MAKKQSTTEHGSRADAPDSSPAGVSFADLISGAHTGLTIRGLRPIPPAIQSITRRRQRERAEEAWRSVLLLQEAIKLWSYFLVCGHLGMRISPSTEKRISEVFPGLRDLGVVLDDLTVDRELDAEAATHRAEADKNLKIDRGPVRRRGRHGRKTPIAGGLVNLIEAFKNLISTHARCLRTVCLESDVFGPASDTLEEQVSTITRVDLDLTGEAAPIDCGATLAAPGFLAARGRLEQELAGLQNLLETAPNAVLLDKEGGDKPLRSSRRDKKRQRDQRIRELHASHQRPSVMTLLELAREDRVLETLGEPVTRDVIRNAIKGRRLRRRN